MPYATPDEFKLRFGEEVIDALDRDRDGEIDDGLAEAMLTDASAEIDVILAGRTPAASDVDFLRMACCEIARYRLYNGDIPESAQKRYDQVISRVRALTSRLAADYAAENGGGLVSRSGRKVFDERWASEFIGR